MRARLRLVALVLGAGCAVAGCGVPTGGAPRTIAASDVPYGLAAPSSSTAASTMVDPVLDASRVFLVAKDDRLVPRPREMAGGTRRDRLTDLLTALADGPTGAERDLQLSTALPPDVRLTVGEGNLSDGTATVDIQLPAEAPSGWASRRAVAQIVLTSTSVTGVNAVRLTLGGEPVEAPLPGGELTSAPLTAADYDVFLTAPAASATPAVPAPPSAEPAPPS